MNAKKLIGMLYIEEPLRKHVFSDISRCVFTQHFKSILQLNRNEKNEKKKNQGKRNSYFIISHNPRKANSAATGETRVEEKKKNKREINSTAVIRSPYL